MQEIKKSRILLASVLKPVDDTRMFEKFGVSLAKNYEVHIAGYPATVASMKAHIHLHPHLPFLRISIERLLTPFKIFRTLVRLKPALFIFSTHELLFIAVIARLFLGCKIIYDVQENYFRNILHTKTFPPIIRILVACYVRLKELMCRPFINHFFYAERGYTREINFLASENATVLENKVSRSVIPDRKSPVTPGNKFHFIFSGTLAESTGVFLAIDVVEKFFKLDQRVQFTIIGYCAHESTWKRLKNRVQSLPYITLIGGDQLVPHAEIIQALQKADVGFITYPANPSTEHSIPTKLFEYLALNLPILLIDHPEWKKFCASCEAAITFLPDQLHIHELWHQLQNHTFYTSKPEGIYWDEEEHKLLERTKQFLTINTC